MNTETIHETAIRYVRPAAASAADVYQRLGELVVVVQWFDEKLLDMISRLDAGANFWDARQRFVPLSFAQKIARAASLFAQRMDELEERLPERGEAAAAWREKFKSLIAGCHELRERRNSLVHSSYVHLEAGGEVLGIARSDPQHKNPESRSRHSDAGSDLDAALAFSAPLAWELGMAHLQVVHWQQLWSTPLTSR
jgi:hypothetical protein